MPFRKALIWIRDKQRNNAGNLYFFAACGFIAFAIIAVLVDSFAPWEGWGMVIRSFLMLPLAAFSFAGLYAFSLEMSEKRSTEAKVNDEEWTPFRLRYSPKFRRNISFIIGAVGFVLIYALNDFTGYTVVASFTVTLIIALVAFCRYTRSESKRAELSIPDPRDSMFSERMEQYRREQERAKREAESSDEDVIYTDDDDRVVQSKTAQREKDLKKKQQ